jgi:hypothetical protein
MLRVNFKNFSVSFIIQLLLKYSYLLFKIQCNVYLLFKLYIWTKCKVLASVNETISYPSVMYHSRTANYVMSNVTQANLRCILGEKQLNQIEIT